MKPLKFIIAVLITIGLSACDKIKDPYADAATGTGSNISGDTIYGDLTYNGRKVLIEEHTGQQCGHCPKGARKLISWEKDWLKGKMVMLAVHAGNFAEVSEKYPLDLRNEHATKIYEKFPPTGGHPSVLISRKSLAGQPVTPIVNVEKWESTLKSFDFTASDVKLLVRNIHDAQSAQNALEIKVVANRDISTALSLVIHITEDSILGAQKDYGLLPADDYVPEYYHRHDLRGAIGGTFGNTLTTDGMASGDTLTSNFETVLDPAWNKDHVEFVVYVMDTETYEVLQADKVHAVKKK